MKRQYKALAPSRVCGSNIPKIQCQYQAVTSSRESVSANVVTSSRNSVSSRQ
ncbi:hypothetical protein DPMN_040178 [Dreissena polymorpha]|uniref:Uncharacterized protein n=1 Tax=Dreissena polymorpha TaxID=45954 RepID=A0A9D4CX78_DREPO|nr:hypothetical protein DPMN_040135 [Dreissena polymorpha]KAH3733744.1 hypothetical protein DPMN_040178 [Dreissena polymorpha]